MRFAGAALAVSTLVLMAGCGSYTKADFVARADAICATTVRETRSVPPPSSGGGSAQELHALAGYLNRVLPLARAEARQITALRRPGGTAREQATLHQYLAALGGAVGDYGTLAAAASRGDASGVASAESNLRASQVSALAQRYGMRSCAAPGATVG